MKRLLFILFSLSMVLLLPFEGGPGCECLSSVQAQTKDHPVDSIYVYNENDSLIFMQEWEYDGSLVVNEVQYKWDKDGVKHGDFNTFKAFDAKGNNVLYVTLDWDNVKQDWKGRGRLESVYNTTGTSNLKQFAYHSLWKEDQWTKDSTWTCRYNAQGLPVLTAYQTFRNDEWQEQYKLIQDYDGSREIYHEEYQGRNENGLIGISKWSQLYSGSTKISDRQYSWSGTEFVPSSWDTVGIENGKTTLEASYIWDKSGVNMTGKSKEEWAFNGDKRQTLHITYSGWENGAFVPSTKQVDEWSGSTNTMTAKYNWDKTNKQWVGTTKTENITSDGYTIKKTYSGWANNDFVPATIDSTKNENGKQVYYAKWVTSDGITWTGSTKKVNAYEGANQILQEVYSGWDNGWVGFGNKVEQIWKNDRVWSKVSSIWSSGWVPYVKDSTEYEGNDITFSVHYKWTGSAWEGDNNKTNYSQTYVSPGQKEWTTSLKWENNQWTNYIQTRSIYESGKLAEERSQQWSGSVWVDVKVVYHTWENGVETFTRTEEWDSATGKLKMTSEYKYVHEKDAQGRDQEEYKMKCGADSVWVGTGYTRTMWYYETRGDSAITSTVNYTWKTSDWERKDSAAVWKGIAVSSQMFITAKFSWTGSVWQYTSLATNTYDEKGRAVSQDSKNCKNGVWTGVYWYYKEYDQYGNTISDARYGAGSGGNTWRGTSRNDWGYDEFGNQTKKVNFRWNTSTNDWQITDQYDYLFDARNRCTMSSHSFLAITGDLIQDSYEEYFYLGNDTNPYSTLQYEYVVPEGEETGEWILKQQDTNIYDNNDSSDKLREEIHGTWSKGVVVKYERTVYFYHDDPK